MERNEKEGRITKMKCEKVFLESPITNQVKNG